MILKVLREDRAIVFSERPHAPFLGNGAVGDNRPIPPVFFHVGYDIQLLLRRDIKVLKKDKLARGRVPLAQKQIKRVKGQDEDRVGRRDILFDERRRFVDGLKPPGVLGGVNPVVADLQQMRGIFIKADEEMLAVDIQHGREKQHGEDEHLDGPGLNQPGGRRYQKENGDVYQREKPYNPVVDAAGDELVRAEHHKEKEAEEGEDEIFSVRFR